MFFVGKTLWKSDEQSFEHEGQGKKQIAGIIIDNAFILLMCH